MAGVGSAITVTVASNVTAAVVGGQIGTTGKVYVLAAQAPSGGPSEARTPTYVTRAIAAATAVAGLLTVSPAVAVAIAQNTTITALLPGATIASTVGGSSPAGDVFVLAAPDATTESDATGASSGAATIAGPFALTVALHTAVSTSLATIAGRLAAGQGGAGQRCLGRACEGQRRRGVTPGSTTSDSQIQGWLGQLTGLISTASGLLGSLVPLPAGLPVPSVPAVPGIAAPNSSGSPVSLGAAAATAVNLMVSTTISSVPAGGVTVSGPLSVQAIGFTLSGAHADATGATSGAATAVGVGVSVISLVALLGGTVSANGVTVETLVRLNGVPQTTRPVAEAFAGAGSGAGVVAGAFALSISAVTSAAAILPGAQVSAGSGPVVVYADANTHAQANTDAASSPGVTPVNAAAVGVGTAVTLTVAANTTLAVIGGVIATTGAVYVLTSAAPPGGPSEARTPDLRRRGRWRRRGMSAARWR